MKLMVEGWREDFKDPALPVGVIGFCAGGDTQTTENFETKGLETAPYIREAQRLGLADAGDPVNTAYMAADDIQIPGLHPIKKCEHGVRAARWALNRIYKTDVEWDSAKLVSTEVQGDVMVLTFDKSVMPDDWSTIIEGFSIAGEDGKFAMAYARFPLQSAKSNASNARGYDTKTIRVWSPMVKEPKAVRYSWASSPLGNLKVSGNPALPLQNFRTDSWDYPEVEDPSTIAKPDSRKLKEEVPVLTLNRRIKEGEMIKELIEKLDTLIAPITPAAK
jgi:sialate O-acetylesterase